MQEQLIAQVIRVYQSKAKCMSHIFTAVDHTYKQIFPRLYSNMIPEEVLFTHNSTGTS